MTLAHVEQILKTSAKLIGNPGPHTASQAWARHFGNTGLDECCSACSHLGIMILSS